MLNLFLYLTFYLFHPFFVSVTEITHNEKAKTLQVSCKIFFDDFETALEKKYKIKVDILKTADRERTNPLIEDYLAKHLQISVNGKLVSMRYLGYNIEEDAAWCFLEVPKVSQVKRMDIKNDILFEDHAAQINMLHITVKGKRQSTKLDNPESQASFNW